MPAATSAAPNCEGASSGCRGQLAGRDGPPHAGRRRMLHPSPKRRLVVTYQSPGACRDVWTPDASAAPWGQPAALNAVCWEITRPAHDLVLAQLTSRPQARPRAQDFGLSMKHINIKQAATRRSRAGGRPRVKPCRSLELGHLSALNCSCFGERESRRLFGAAHPRHRDTAECPGPLGQLPPGSVLHWEEDEKSEAASPL